MLRLCYFLPDGEREISLQAHPEDVHWLSWLYHMINMNPDIIFFYTVETTDIF